MRIVIRGSADRVQQAAAALTTKLPSATTQPPPAEDPSHRGDGLAILALLIALPGAINNALGIIDRMKKVAEEREAAKRAVDEAKAEFPDIEVTLLDEPEDTK